MATLNFHRGKSGGLGAFTTDHLQRLAPRPPVRLSGGDTGAASATGYLHLNGRVLGHVFLCPYLAELKQRIDLLRYDAAFIVVVIIVLEENTPTAATSARMAMTLTSCTSSCFTFHHEL
ncbi:MAG: hypothetical protein MZV65_47155 [Chromatiales bacterium]|nr:hypothetical protein [Chromatiales bacterium]